MTDDRTLLERAAKAAGIEVPSLLKGRPSPWFYIDDNGIHKDVSCGGDGTAWRTWNPLTDDGDALQLAARLRLTVGDEDQSVRSMAFAYARHRPDIPHSYEPSQWDPAAAYRRAIVRAAAAMAGE